MNPTISDVKNYHIAVFDLGKTNKKLLIFDQNLDLLDQASTQIDEIENEDYKAEDAGQIFRWYQESLAGLSNKYNIRVISISSHGAAFVTLNEHGDLSLPPICYTTEPGENFHARFFREFGPPNALQKSTATAELKALINIAQGIYFVREKYPSVYSRTKHLLNYPQYYGYLMTGSLGIEKTYLGSHTYLWDFEKSDWSSVAKGLGADKLYPGEFKKPWDVLGHVSSKFAATTGLKPDVMVTLGIHDSNGALLPYLISGFQNFILNSTGTWCVVMRPEKKVAFKEDEIGKTVFYNISAFEEPVKTAIFMGGEEYAVYDDILRKFYGNDYRISFDHDLYQKIVREKKLFILPSVVKGAGQFPNSDARITTGDQTIYLEELKTKGPVEYFNNGDELYAALNISLALQTEVALQRAGMERGMTIYVEGGFRKNESYNRVLTTLFPGSPVCLTELQEASALGAAILGKAAVEKVDLMSMRNLMKIRFEPVPKTVLDGIESYRKEFLRLIG